MKIIINEEMKKEILEMHSRMKKKIVKEQQIPSIDIDVESQLNDLLKNGCVKYGKVVPLKKTNPPQYQFAIKQESSSNPGKVRYLFVDKKYAIFENGIMTMGKDSWACSKPEPKKEEPVASVAATKQLNANQIKVLEILKQKGWFHEPAPTDVEVEQGLFEKLNLSDAENPSNNPLVTQYNKWFKDDYPNGFFVFKKVTAQNPEEIKPSTKVEVTTQSCKAAIESLYNNMTSPMTYPLSNEEKSNFRITAKTCAEPANSSKFLLRFGLKNKVKELQNSRII